MPLSKDQIEPVTICFFTDIASLLTGAITPLPPSFTRLSFATLEGLLLLSAKCSVRKSYKTQLYKGVQCLDLRHFLRDERVLPVLPLGNSQTVKNLAYSLAIAQLLH